MTEQRRERAKPGWLSRRLGGGAPASLISRADRAREARQWDLAARYYRKSLDRNPRNSSIWVQYGHALKESGRLADAEAAYRRALAGEPEAADCHLQLGHVLKLQGRAEEAKAAYLRALSMYDRLSAEPLQELTDLGWSESRRSGHRGRTPPVKPMAVVGEDPFAVLRRRDAVMREMFDGVVKATRPDVICDIGAFGGEESARFCQIAPTSRCYAFEANSDNITRFIKPRQDMAGVVVENIAVCDVDGEVTFNVLEAGDSFEDIWKRAAGSLNVRTDEIRSRPVTVSSVRLDTYFRNDLEAKSTFILWIDVEGALDRVFAGGEKVLSQTIMLRAEVERLEFWAGQRMAEEVVALAEKAGFVLLGDTWTPEAAEQSDVLMINRQWLHLAANSANNMKGPA